MLRAYLRAESLLSTTQPGCHLTWSLLASIGRIESGHARGGQVDSDGKTVSPILGPALNGNGFAAIRDTDSGAHDGDRTWDRAVGPMQFIPATWARYGADATGDGVADPHNVYHDRAAATARSHDGGKPVRRELLGLRPHRLRRGLPGRQRQRPGVRARPDPSHRQRHLRPRPRRRRNRLRVTLTPQ